MAAPCIGTFSIVKSSEKSVRVHSDEETVFQQSKLAFGVNSKVCSSRNDRMIELCKNPVELCFHVDNYQVLVIFDVEDLLFESQQQSIATFLGMPWSEALEKLDLKACVLILQLLC